MFAKQADSSEISYVCCSVGRGGGETQDRGGGGLNEKGEGGQEGQRDGTERGGGSCSGVGAVGYPQCLS